MNRRLFFLASSAFVSTFLAPAPFALAQDSDAAAALAKAEKQAGDSDKKLLLIFWASWCGYCRIMDAMLADRKCAPIVDKYFVVYHLRAQERKDAARAQQLAGADALYNTYANEKTGLPFTVVLDGQGKRVTDSLLRNGENFGFPGTPEELAGFESMMRTAAPAITADELRTLRQTCVKLLKT